MSDPKHGGPVPPGAMAVREALGDTPRTDAYVERLIRDGVSPDSLEHFARTLERELAAAQARIAELEANQCEAEPEAWLDADGTYHCADNGFREPIYRKAKR